MALEVGRSTYNAATVGVKVSMNEDIALISPDDTVTVNTLGAPRAITNIRQDWLNDGLMSYEVAPDATSNTASTTISLSDADATKIRVGDILQRKGGTVQALVTAKGANGDLTVTRPYASSTDEQLTSAHILVVVGQAIVEGADPQAPRSEDMTSDYNVTQIFQEKIQATRTARKNEQYGIKDPYTYELDKKMRELAIRQNVAYLHSRRNQDTSNKRRSMGGLFYYAANNAITGTVAQFETKLNDSLQALWEDGGKPDVLICSPKFKREFSNLNADKVIEERGDTGVGRTKTVYESDFGRIELVMDRWLAGFEKQLLIERRFVTPLAFDGWFHEMLAKTGDQEQGEVVGEFSLEVRAPNAHATLTVTDLED
jgi:Family of unknown function (DUF5309)